MNLKDTTLLKNQALTGEGWASAASGKTIDVLNPFDGSKVGEIPVLSEAEVQAAVAASATAQKSWAAKTAHERGDLLHAWADLVDQHADDIAAIMTAEQGKPLKEAKGEVIYANSFLRWFAEEGKRDYGDVIPTKVSNLRYLVLKQPVGVCAAITPWNFPAAMITRKVGPALASGCTMLVKPATETPLTALAFAELAVRAGIPAGVLQVVTGQSSVIGKVLTESDTVRKLSFTGSTEIGRMLMAQSAPTLKKLSMELGGNAPFIVFEDADLDKAAEGLIASKYRNAGQTCVCANRIYVQESVKDAFVERFVSKVRALKVGNGAEEGTDIGPLVNQKAVEKVQSLLADALEKGADCVYGGNTNPASPLTFNPTVLTNIGNTMDIAHEEIFGPIAAIQTFVDEAEVIARANDTIYGLASYFYTNDLGRAWRVCEGLEYGMIGHNTGMISNEVAPFGGVKHSGFGREGSKYGLDEYVEIKYWCSDIG